MVEVECVGGVHVFWKWISVIIFFFAPFMRLLMLNVSSFTCFPLFFCFSDVIFSCFLLLCSLFLLLFFDAVLSRFDLFYYSLLVFFSYLICVFSSSQHPSFSPGNTHSTYYFKFTPFYPGAHSLPLSSLNLHLHSSLFHLRHCGISWLFTLKITFIQTLTRIGSLHFQLLLPYLAASGPLKPQDPPAVATIAADQPASQPAISPIK